MRLALIALLSTLVLAGAARADSTPVGPLPAGPTTQIVTQRGALVALALPAQPSGRSWRQKGNIDTRVLRQVSEGDIGKDVVVVFRATGRGTVTVRFGSTRGETRKAYAGKRFRVTVR